jgi:hypothetical protein
MFATVTDERRNEGWGTESTGGSDDERILAMEQEEREKRG